MLTVYYVLWPTQPPVLSGTAQCAACRLAALLDVLCARQPRYACFLWTAARNLVRDVIGHVTSVDLQSPVKVADESDEVGERRRRRAAVEMELLYGDDTHLPCKLSSAGV